MVESLLGICGSCWLNCGSVEKLRPSVSVGLVFGTKVAPLGPHLDKSEGTHTAPHVVDVLIVDLTEKCAVSVQYCSGGFCLNFLFDVACWNFLEREIVLSK